MALYLTLIILKLYISYAKKNFSNLDHKFLPFILLNYNILKQVIKPVEKKTLMYWLRVFYNSRLFLKNYVNKLANKK